jgi:uncharacterized RDD family membrane protein YckC
MSETRRALIIANSRYENAELCQLQAPANDAESLARVLGDPAIGGFEVRTVVNQPCQTVSLEIETFFENRKRDDLLLLYFSGHGVRDIDDGRLYFATVDTQMIERKIRRSTAVPSHFVNEVMDRCGSRRQILLLDCCYSGAFKEGMIAKGDQQAGAEQLQGQGRIVLTASNALQFSFEKEQAPGGTVGSIFTSALVDGLETGKADLDHDGYYALDEVYDYVYASVSERQSGQKPMKMGFLEGKIYIGSNPHPTVAELPQELRDSLGDLRQWVRLGAVHELERLLAGSNKGVSLAAQAALASLAAGDDSFEVRNTAEARLAAFRGGTGRPAPVERQTRQVDEKPEEQVLAEKKEAERQEAARQEAARQEAARQEAARKAAARREAERKEAEKRETERQEAPQIERPAREAPAFESPRPRDPVEQAPVTAGRRAAADFVDAVCFLLLYVTLQQFGPAAQAVGLPAFIFLVPLIVSKTGKTIGHFFTGTRIVDRRGAKLSYPRSFLFCFVWLFVGAFAVGLLTLMTVSAARGHQALYELASGAVVVRDVAAT